MPKTKAQIIAEAQVVKNATEVGENTATRVGGVLEDLADADGMVIIPVTGTQSGDNITLSSNPFTQVQTAVNAGQHVVVRVTYGSDIVDFTMNTYSASVATYIGTANFLQLELQLICNASSAVITNRNTSNTFSTGESVPNTGVDNVPTENSTNLVKSGGVYKTLYGADETIYENVGQVEYYQTNGVYEGWNGSGIYTPLLTEDSLVNRIVFPPFKAKAGETEIKYWVGYTSNIDSITPSNVTEISSGTLAPLTTSFTLELETPVTIPSGNAVYVLLYGVSQQVYILGGSNYATSLQPYSADDERKLYLATRETEPFSVQWRIATRDSTARWKGCSPILQYKADGVIPDLISEDQELQRQINDIVEGKDETIYENVGQIDYYKQHGVCTGWNGTGVATPLFEQDAVINTIIFPPFLKNSVGTTEIKYWVGYASVASNVGLTPSQQFELASGVLSPDLTEYSVTLDNPVTIPAGASIFVLLYGAYIYGGPNTWGTSEPKYSEEDVVKVYLNTAETNPFSVYWTRGSGNATARYIGCSPIVKFVELSKIEQGLQDYAPTILDEVSQEVEELVAAENSVEVYLPDKLYAVVGDTIQIFFQSCVVAKSLESYNIYAYCSKGQTFARYYEYTPTADDIGTTTFTIYVKDNKKDVVLGYKTCELVTVAAPTSPATAKNIFTFGDSLTTFGQWVGEMKRRLVGSSTYDGIQGNALSNINFFGYKSATIHGQSVDYFGVGGWTWASYITKMTGGAFRFYVNGVSSLSVGATYTNNGHTFTIQEINVTSGSGNIRCTTLSTTDTPTSSGTLTKASGNGDATITFSSFETENANPLWDDANNKFSFIPYVNNVGASTIDVVYVLLTWNSQSSWKEYSAEQTSGHVQNAKTFARTLHTEYPNAKLKIMGLQMPSIIGGLGANYGASGNMVDGEGMKQCAVNYNKAFQDLCNLDEFSPYCEFVDTATQFDTLYNMPMVQKNVNLRNSNVKEYIGTNGVHPTDSGYYQIADAVYRNFVANYCQG